MSERRPGPLPVIGWYEYVDLPGWGIRGLRAKVDTGARTSALHVEHIEELAHDRVRFDVVRNRRRPERHVRVEARIVRRGRVRSSTGHRTMRLFVATVLRIGEVEREVEFSLVDRERMIFRVLLGRMALSGHFTIDVGRRAALGPRRRRRVRRGA
jgi:hypothetical protein